MKYAISTTGGTLVSCYECGFLLTIGIAILAAFGFNILGTSLAVAPRLPYLPEAGYPSQLSGCVVGTASSIVSAVDAAFRDSSAFD